MDPKLQEFLDTAKAKERKAFEADRDKLLISLGLTSNETIREYSDVRSYEFDRWDQEKQMYYREVQVPIKVTDEEYEEIKKYAPKAAVEAIELDNKAENFLAALNTISLVIGMIAVVLNISNNLHKINGKLKK